MKNLLLILTLITSTVALSACNTIEGAGRDIESAGESIQNL